VLKKVLVANRGEIAVRVLRACEELGIRTVAVYSEADRAALHVRYADEAYQIGPAPARESYLRIDRIIDVARHSGADAIHPGYGFLSERAEFAQACRDAGIIFVGPSPESIRLLGDKVAAREVMRKAGVPVIPGSDGPVESLAEAEEVARRVGFPLLVKAAAGGGGKGMRVVQRMEDLADSLRVAASEANAAFGDSTVYMEKMLDNVRHVEVQVLCDHFGNAIHLGERECSIQRRHQKLVEETPSKVVNEELRQQMGQVAVLAARTADYASAGTVEFLVDRNRNFFFLEVNTRLQVEHPITEMVTGVDLVIEQLRMAGGRRLRYKQNDIAMHGHAIECRIQAEDPDNGFLPSIGRITAINEPSGPGVRVDSGIYEGFDVSLYYDPLIAKLIVSGETRAQAIRRMRRALAEYKILGIHTTIPFHVRLMDSPTFIANRFDTAFLERQERAAPEKSLAQVKVAALAAAAVAHYAKRDASAALGKTVSGNQQNPWRLLGRPGALRGQ
jgi:acetyl-CoA carboxylase, biotin carboxylase subunit